MSAPQVELAPPGPWKTLWWTKVAVAIFWNLRNWTFGVEVSGPGMFSVVLGPLCLAFGDAR